jgi:hypothetical protein
VGFIYEFCDLINFFFLNYFSSNIPAFHQIKNFILKTVQKNKTK